MKGPKPKNIFFTPNIETLEVREVPALTATLEIAPGDLIITGTADADRIVVRQIGGKISIEGVSKITWLDYQSQVTSNVPAAMVKKIWIYGNGGNDRIYLNSQDIKGRQALRPVNGTYIDGGEGDDIIAGTEAGDTIYGRGGADKIYGRGGSDTIYGGSENDTLNGGDGNDYLYGEGGEDTLQGGKDNDTLFGGDGNDWLYGYTGNDTLNGQNDNDHLFGYDGDDVLDGGAHNDIIKGGRGKDFLFGSSGDDLLNGEADQDNLFGGSGFDTLYGIAGEDYLSGGSDNDTLYITVDFVKMLKNQSEFLPLNSYTNGSVGTDTFDITLNMKGFATAVLSPYIKDVRRVLKAYAPLVKRLQAPIPLVSQFKSGMTFGSAIANLGGNQEAYKKFISLYNSASALASVDKFFAKNYWLGTFTVSSLSNIQATALGNLKSMLANNPLVNAARKASFQISFLENPATLIQTLIGKTNVELIKYTVPQINIQYNGKIAERRFLVGGFVPVTGRLKGEVRLALGAELSFKSQSLFNGYTNGLFVTAWGDLSASLYIEAVAGGSFKYKGYKVGGAEVGAGGGVTGTLQFRYDYASSSMKTSSYLSYNGYLTAEFSVGPFDWSRQVNFVTGTIP